MSRVKTNGWPWIPSLYFAQGLPFAIIVISTEIFYQNMGLSNAENALLTAWLYLPWALKPLWSPLLEGYKSKKFWVLITQIASSAGLISCALLLQTPIWLTASWLMFWILAFIGATHDIASDGIYLLALSPDLQAGFVGVRTLSWQIAKIVGQGGLVMSAGYLTTTVGTQTAWSIGFAGLGIIMLLIAIHHYFFLPCPDSGSDKPALQQQFRRSFKAFLTKPHLGLILSFLLFYNLAISQVYKIMPLFMLDTEGHGGLHYSTLEVGRIYGTYGVIALAGGSLLGGWLIKQYGMHRMFVRLTICQNLPIALFIGIGVFPPHYHFVVSLAVIISLLGFGLGSAGYFVIMMRIVAKGDFQTSHFAIGTGLMAISIMAPGMVSGWLQSQLHYPLFYAWTLLCTLPVYWITWRVKQRLL